jgi:protein tyrosine/serine phosphatase
MYSAEALSQVALRLQEISFPEIMPPSRIKRIKRSLRKRSMTFRSEVAARTPVPVRRAAAPLVGYAGMLLFDHLFVRVLFPNRHRLSPRAWRAAQPLPYQLRKIKALGVRTVVNLRGNADQTTAKFERAACENLGLVYVDYRLRSRDAPTKEELHGLRQLFDSLEHPILLHCKSGADRAGLASVLYLHVIEGVPIAKAKGQLSLRYGHIRQADTGVLDAVFERYLAHTKSEPIDFFAWVDKHYDPEGLKHAFRSRGWANRIVDGLLRRE